MRDIKRPPLSTADRAASMLAAQNEQIRGIQARGTGASMDQWVIGDGSTTDLTINHGRGTQRLRAWLYENTADRWEVDPRPRIGFPTVNTIRLQFTSAPAADSIILYVG
jgi:hypothetical protein